MIDIQKYGNFKTKNCHKDKRQIILCHTSREVKEYLTSLKFRYNAKYDKIPHYIITKEGKILQLLSNDSYSNFFSDEKINKNSIIICLENLGWLDKKPLTDYYINWKGSIYKGQVYEKKWRDYFFWEPYTNQQIETAADLCKFLTNNTKIKNKCVGHNVKLDGISEFEGIVTRSNFETNFTDLNPSFNFETFTKFLENG